ncbi:MAG: hypothetical protein NVSMB52_21320 [Chloroflexota bacterium]
MGYTRGRIAAIVRRAGSIKVVDRSPITAPTAVVRSEKATVRVRPIYAEDQFENALL